MGVMTSAARLRVIAKRIFDLVFACLGLTLFAPFLMVIAIAIKLDTSGPVFHRQARVGRFGKVFRIHKFRTMIINAERYGPVITRSEDRRVTRVGAVIRKYKLDELPQLIDVIKGDMSLVGARPEVPFYVELYPEALKRVILSMPPGITGPASIVYRNEASILGSSSDPERDYIERIVPDKLRLDHGYVTHWSLWGDFILILRTLWALLT